MLAALLSELLLDVDDELDESDDFEELDEDESLDEPDSFAADSLAAGFEPLPALLSVR